MDNKEKTDIYCENEYNPLKKVITVPPKHMAITEVINETQNYYAEENINTDIAMNQYLFFVETLRREGIKVEELPLDEELNEQVFTRDIGFAIGNQLFVSHMKRDIRQKEVDVLAQWLTAKDIPFQIIDTPSIEGGDVLIDNKQVWLGISDRTSIEALAELEQKLPDHRVTPVPLRQDILHLDCAFNIIDEETALLYPDGVSSEVREELYATYHIIEITEEEQFHMGPNVLVIGEKKLISLPENERINNVLKQAGFTVIEVPFSEIIKSGGSYRCCSLPLIRE